MTWFLAIAILTTTCLLAQPTTTHATLEPGQRDAQEHADEVPLPKEWSHPKYEFRGVWISTKEMLLPRDQLAAKLDAIRDAHFNVVLIDTYFRGCVAYPASAFLPQYPDFQGEDRIGWLVDQIHLRGMQAHLWMEYGFYAYVTKDATKDKSMGPILDKNPELLSVDTEGHRFIHRQFGDFYSLCPSNPKSHELLAKIYAEAVGKYPCDGLCLDRIRYADANYCFCDYCKKQFKLDNGTDLETARQSHDPDTWNAWKRDRTLAAVKTITTALNAVRPKLVITSYVLSPMEMESKAQAWDLWMRDNLLDAVAVSMYGGDVRTQIPRAVAMLGGDARKLICAISAEQPTRVYLTNIQSSREQQTLGQSTWHLGELGDNDFNGLKTGPYSEPSTPPFEARP
jgi:uncharacterized lipoprotein YddW (UPF0748 family)